MLTPKYTASATLTGVGGGELVVAPANTSLAVTLIPFMRGEKGDAAVPSAIGADIKALRDAAGVLANLPTTAKNNLVAAIAEVYSMADNGLNQGSDTMPVADGTAAVGSSKRYARADHVHPIDTSRAPRASPALTGVPTAPTATSGTNNNQIATTAFVNAEIAADRPFESTLANIKMDGAQSVGSLNTVARADHVHPTDTTRAAVASFTNVKTASGYQCLEGGMIIQWGNFSVSAAAMSSTSVNFPIAFPLFCLHGIVNVDNAATEQFGTVSKTKTGMQIQKGTSDSSARTGTWIAIGY